MFRAWSHPRGCYGAYGLGDNRLTLTEPPCHGRHPQPPPAHPARRPQRAGARPPCPSNRRPPPGPQRRPHRRAATARRHPLRAAPAPVQPLPRRPGHGRQPRPANVGQRHGRAEAEIHAGARCCRGCLARSRAGQWLQLIRPRHTRWIQAGAQPGGPAQGGPGHRRRDQCGGGLHPARRVSAYSNVTIPGLRIIVYPDQHRRIGAAVIEGTGWIYGDYLITGINTTSTLHFQDGAPRKIEFQLSLRRTEGGLLGDLTEQLAALL